MTKQKLETNDLWVELVEMGLFTDEELRLVTCVSGYTIETLNKALFVRYGYRDLEQMMGELEE